MGEEGNLYKILMGNPEGKRPLGRSNRRCDHGIINNFMEIN
jgi:hypothetical protein